MWIALTALEQIDQLILESQEKPQLLFKHSTRCSISRVALSRFDRIAQPLGECKFYLLDLLQFRSLSQAISERFNIKHESPQVLLIHAGKCFYHANHLDIEPAEILEQVTDGYLKTL
jgi:bacillithiol system protein YtxJ